MMDSAHRETDKIIADVERQLQIVYSQAHREVSAKLDDYLRRFEKKDKRWRQWVAEGKKTRAEYKEWRMGQIMMGQRWEKMKDTLAEDYVNAHRIAEKIINQSAMDVYAVNHNYGVYEIESGVGLDTSYTLYNHDAVEYLVRENPKLYGEPGKKVSQDIRDGLLKEWNRDQIQSVMLQGILQGESIPNLTKRLKSVTGGNHKAAIRNARTMMTGVQARGRLESYKRAQRMGIEVRKQWVAIIDSRTRHWHRQLDGVVADLDEPFENDIGKIMFPGDPEAKGANIYNCRCTMLSVIKGHELDLSDPNVRPMPNLNGMTYEQWKKQKKSTSHPITKQEDIGKAMRGAWNRFYRGK